MGLLEQAQKQTQEEKKEKLKIKKNTKTKPDPTSKILEEIKKQQQGQKQPTTNKPSTGLLQKAQQQPKTPSPTTPSSISGGLLAKAQGQHTTQGTTALFENYTPVPQGDHIEVVEEQHGFGYKKLGHQRIVFDSSISEYRYELIEPQLNPKEHELKKEISHLFKMLADIDTYDMEYKEKEHFLDQTLEQIITDNSITFENQTKKGRFSTKPTKPTDILKKPDPNAKKNKQKQTSLFSKKKNNQEQSKPEYQFTEYSKDYIYYHLYRDFIGYGRMDIIIHDDGIEDISCDGPDTPIFLHHRKYEAIETNVYFESDVELNNFVVRLCQLSGKQISIYSPIVDGKLPDGSRLQTTLARTVTKGSTFTIRKFKENPLTPIDLINFHSISVEMAAYFWMVIESGASILFCGGTASGKTSALNALSLFVPASHKIISIEDTREVNLPHKNWIAGTTRKGFSAAEEKTGKDIDMFDLIRAALRQRPRVIIVGEVRGKEAYSLFQAMATGHTSYATVHASDIHTLIQRLENPPISLPRALLTSLDVIIFQNAVSIGGKMVRRMISVTEIIKLDSDSNQLIFMAPFTWVSKTDDRWESNHTSKVLNLIRQQNDWDEEQLETEIQNREVMLQWMVKKNIRSYKEVGHIIAEYRKFPEKTLERAQEDLTKP